MADLQLNWDNTAVNASANTTAQRAYKRVKSVGGAFSTSGFTPSNDLLKTANTVIANGITPNKVYEFKVAALCVSGGPTESDVVEQIVFACIEPELDADNDSVDVDVDLSGTDIIKVGYTLKKQSDNSIVGGPIEIARVGDGAPHTFGGLVAGTGYYLEYVLFAEVGGNEFQSNDAAYLGAVCGGNVEGYQVSTVSACMANGFPAGPIYAHLFWSESVIDTSGPVLCEGDPVNQPSSSRAIWILFTSDAAGLVPVITNLNNYPITVGGNPYNIGDGTPNYAYFVDHFPYSLEEVNPGTCLLDPPVISPIPALTADTCFDNSVASDGLILDGNFTMERHASDGTTWGYAADMRDSIILPGGGTPPSAAIAAGAPGPNNNVNKASYSKVTFVVDIPAGQNLAVTIVGKANDGTTGETILVPFAFGPTHVSTKKYFFDANNPITVTVNENP